jgi:AcrR family transcriptional regulator
MAVPTEQDTRQRLVDAATKLFAQRGFRKVTVREICREARANVAAVNYHFQDKTGLYREVLKRGIALMRETTELSQRAADDASPDERLRLHVRTVVSRMMRGGNDAWLARILQHEFADPTRELDTVVERALRPRLQVLAGLVADVLGCRPDDERVARSVASIQAQYLLAIRHPMTERLPWRHHWTAEDLSNHIANFSVAGLTAI